MSQVIRSRGGCWAAPSGLAVRCFSGDVASCVEKESVNEARESDLVRGELLDSEALSSQRDKRERRLYDSYDSRLRGP